MEPKDFFPNVFLELDKAVSRIIDDKPENEKYLTANEFRDVTVHVRNVFKSALGTVPRLVDAACSLAQAAIERSRYEKAKHINNALAIGGGVTGIALVVGGILSAIGVTTGVAGWIVAFFVGTSIAGPIGTVASGAVIFLIAGYFLLQTSSPEARSDKAVEALKTALTKAESNILDEYRDRLGKYTTT